MSAEELDPQGHGSLHGEWFPSPFLEGAGHDLQQSPAQDLYLRRGHDDVIHFEVIRERVRTEAKFCSAHARTELKFCSAHARTELKFCSAHARTELKFCSAQAAHCAHETRTWARMSDRKPMTNWERRLARAQAPEAKALAEAHTQFLINMRERERAQRQEAEESEDEGEQRKEDDELSNQLSLEEEPQQSDRLALPGLPEAEQPRGVAIDSREAEQAHPQDPVALTEPEQKSITEPLQVVEPARQDKPVPRAESLESVSAPIPTVLEDPPQRPESGLEAVKPPNVPITQAATQQAREAPSGFSWVAELSPSGLRKMAAGRPKGKDVSQATPKAQEPEMAQQPSPKTQSQPVTPAPKDEPPKASVQAESPIAPADLAASLLVAELVRKRPAEADVPEDLRPAKQKLPPAQRHQAQDGQKAEPSKPRGDVKRRAQAPKSPKDKPADPPQIATKSRSGKSKESKGVTKVKSSTSARSASDSSSPEFSKTSSRITSPPPVAPKKPSKERTCTATEEVEKPAAPEAWGKPRWCKGLDNHRCSVAIHDLLPWATDARAQPMETPTDNNNIFWAVHMSCVSRELYKRNYQNVRVSQPTSTEHLKRSTLDYMVANVLKDEALEHFMSGSSPNERNSEMSKQCRSFDCSSEAGSFVLLAMMRILGIHIYLIQDGKYGNGPQLLRHPQQERNELPRIPILFISPTASREIYIATKPLMAGTRARLFEPWVCRNPRKCWYNFPERHEFLERMSVYEGVHGSRMVTRSADKHPDDSDYTSDEGRPPPGFVRGDSEDVKRTLAPAKKSRK